MTYYPIGIPTLCRYEHFKRCVESLAKNTHADKTELVIGLDYPPSDKYREGYEKISRYVETIKGFAKVTVLRHEHNLGAEANWKFVRDYIFCKNEAVIMTEDDNVFSPNFLDYINKALQYYKNNEHVSSICGFTPLRSERYFKHIYLSPTMCAWGYATWKDKMVDANELMAIGSILKDTRKSLRVFFSSPQCLSMIIEMTDKGVYWGDAANSAYNILNGRYQCRTTESLCQNIGIDGSGLHCGTNDALSQAFIRRGVSKEEYFLFKNAPSKCDFLTKFWWFFVGNDMGTIRIKCSIYILYKYIKFRLRKNDYGKFV